MNILHISDLHYGLEDDAQPKLIRAFLHDMDPLVDSVGPLDAIVFSGDLVSNPDAPDVYGRLLDSFIVPLLEALSLSTDRLILAPGNHDVSFAALERRRLQFESLRSNSGDQSFLNDSNVLHEMSDYARGISEAFFILAEAVGSPWESPFLRRISVEQLGISFVSINTAVCCSPKGSRADHGKLDFPMRPLSKELSLLAKQQAIFVGHHPFAHMSDGTTRVLQPTIAPVSRAYLYGHVHQPRPAQIIMPGSNFAQLQSGALSAKGDAFQGYSTLQISTGGEQRVVHYRTFYRDRQTFDIGINVSESGIFEVDKGAAGFWKNVKEAPKAEDYLKWIQDAGQELLSELDQTLEGRSLWKSFVFPRITKVNALEVAEGRSDELLSLARILESSENIVVSAAPESGGTSVLNFIAQYAIRHAPQLANPLTPVRIDAQALKAYQNALHRAVKLGMPDLRAPIASLLEVQQHSRLTFLVDNCDPASETETAALSLLGQQYPAARFIVMIRTPPLVQDFLRPQMFLQQFLYARLQPFSRRGVHELIVKWELPQKHNPSRVVDDTLIRFRSLGIPLNGAYLSMYLSVLEKVTNYNPLNSSTVVENFVEAILEKVSIGGLFRKDFDYRNQIQLLSYCAERMARAGTYLVPYETIYDWLREYFKTYGLAQDSEVAIKYFITSHILVDIGNNVAFRHNLFLSFFIAYRMQRSDEFKRWLTENPRYLSFVHELEIYGGLTRDDAGMLELLRAHYLEYASEIKSSAVARGWPETLENFRTSKHRGQRRVCHPSCRAAGGRPP